MKLKITPKSRKGIELIEPHKLISWVIHFFSEIFGTLILTFLFGGLYIVLPNGHYIIDYLHNAIFISIYCGFIVVGILSLFFKRWSSDLNPIISIYKVIIGVETYRYCFFKIFSQIIGGVLCGLLIMWCTSNVIKTGRNTFINNKLARHGFFNIISFSKLGGFFFTFISELYVGVLFIWAIFTKTIKKSYKQLTTFIIITYVAFLAISNGTSSFNALRAFAQDFGAIITGKSTINLWITFSATILSTITAPFFLVFLQYIFNNYIHIWLIKLIIPKGKGRRKS